MLGWPSPVMTYMASGKAPLHLTSDQMAWMVACIDMGNFVMAVPAGRLMDRLGRKFAVSVSAPLMFAGWMLILFGQQVSTTTGTRRNVRRLNLVVYPGGGGRWEVRPSQDQKKYQDNLRIAFEILVQST